MIDFKKVTTIAILTSMLGIGTAFSMEKDLDDNDNRGSKAPGITSLPAKQTTAELEEELRTAELRAKIAEQNRKEAQEKAETAKLNQEMEAQKAAKEATTPPSSTPVPSAKAEAEDPLARLAKNIDHEGTKAVKKVSKFVDKLGRKPHHHH
ncbi:MAG: hypothetical protein ACD_16C00028G0005 [uncultured bacterium]|nr:MAG: hypothetical protein ACD_16C00028G0005 [uncultured bacterium]HBG33948.1 hypothetical protein [Holosporales bacterium]HBW24531.1 hypothetical protein [Holosporales bacterium]HCC25304.1 hypothetical protein [Holosporales bacterium]HCE96184.1 hypothetical protein [Holosporales bacterium]